MYNNLLPYGQYYFVKIAGMFYAGKEPIFSITTTTKRPSRTARDGRPYEYGEQWRINFRRLQKKKKKGKLPTYEKRIGNVTIETKIITGFKDKMTKNFAEVKKFRRLDQAKSVCNNLAKAYSGIATPTIEIYNGTSSKSNSI